MQIIVNFWFEKNSSAVAGTHTLCGRLLSQRALLLLSLARSTALYGSAARARASEIRAATSVCGGYKFSYASLFWRLCVSVLSSFFDYIIQLPLLLLLLYVLFINPEKLFILHVLNYLIFQHLLPFFVYVVHGVLAAHSTVRMRENKRNV